MAARHQLQVGQVPLRESSIRGRCSQSGSLCGPAKASQSSNKDPRSGGGSKKAVPAKRLPDQNTYDRESRPDRISRMCVGIEPQQAPMILHPIPTAWRV